MSVNKLGIILFSSFLIFATAPLAPAQSTQDQKQEQTKKQTQKGAAKKDTGTTTERKGATAESKSTTTTEKAGKAEKSTATGKTETGKTGAKKAKKTSSMSGEKVREVQMALKNNGFDPGPIDGIMGPMTMTALRNFQSHNNLQVTGNLNSETENALLHGATAGTTKRSSVDLQNQQPLAQQQQTYSQNQQTTTDQSQQSLNKPEPSLEESIGVNNEPSVSSVDDVKQVQQALTDLMYNPGEVNGIMTSQTQQAIREFQFLNGLPATGMVDEPTKIAIDTQWRGGIENAQLGQTPYSAQRAKPSPIGGELEQNQPQTQTQTQNRTGTYNQKSTTSSDTTYKQDKTDHSGKHHDQATSGKMDKDAADRVSKAAAVLQDLTASADKRVPNELLERAEAIAVIPHMIKGAFGIGGRYGKGVVSERMTGGRWSAPAFIEIGGGSFGAQIGATSTDLVLVFTDRKAMDTLQNGKDLKLGVDAGIVAGPIGREAEAGTNAKLQSAIYAYSRAKGLFAGVALDGAVLNMDNDMNRKVYGDSVDAKQVLNGNVAANATVRPFMDTLEKVTPKKRISQR